MNTIAIAYGQEIDQSLRILVVLYAITVVFTNVRKLRVLCQYAKVY